MPQQAGSAAREGLVDMAATFQNGVKSVTDGEGAWKLVLKGSASLALAIGAYCAGVFIVTSTWWSILKLVGYMIMGFAFFGLYDVALGCSSQSSRRLFGSVELSRIIGQVSLLVLLKPLQSLNVESLPEQGAGLCRRWAQKLQNFLPLSFSFNTLMSSRKDKINVGGSRIALQIAAVGTFALIFFPIMVFKLGWSGLVRFWLIPYLYMHFQMGTFTKGLTLKEQQHLAAKYSPYNVVKELFVTTFATSSKVVNIARQSLALEKRNQTQSSKDVVTSTVSGSAFSSVGSSAQPRAHWFNICYLSLVHAGGIYGISLLARAPKSEIFTLMVLFMGTYIPGAFGITAGVHRLWAHRSYEATAPMRVLLMLLNSVANQGSILRWARDHRLHHKHVDTPNDPHDANRGFWYSHVGWLLVHKDEGMRKAGKGVHMEDLYADAVVMFQHKNYFPISFAMCYGLPSLLGWGAGCSMWNSFWVGGMLRYVCLLHATWLVNSAAHLWGDRPYLPNILPAENWVVSLLACGEGWHNFHHAYPYDYSASEYGPLHLNLTTAFLNTAAAFGLVSHRKKAHPRRAGGGAVSVESLPMYTMETVKACAAQAAGLVVVNNNVYDLTEFEDKHPGGPKILKAYYGKDATRAFHGGVHKHTEVAMHLLQGYQVGRLHKEGTPPEKGVVGSAAHADVDVDGIKAKIN